MDTAGSPMNGLWHSVSPAEQLELARMLDWSVRASIAAEFFVDHRLTVLRLDLLRLGLDADLTDAEIAACRDAILRGLEHADALVNFEDLFFQELLPVLIRALGEVVNLLYRVREDRAADPRTLERELWHHHEYACGVLGVARGDRRMREGAVAKAMAAGPVGSGFGFFEYGIEVNLNPPRFG